MKNYNNEILNDCAWFAEKHRGKNKLSGAHWSTIIRFTKLFDEAVRLQQRVDTLEAYIADYCQERRWIHQDKTMIVKKDGDSWCAVLPDFKDLQQSESRWFSGDINKYMDDVYWYLNDEPQPQKEGE